jgi:hypothetical protein
MSFTYDATTSAGRVRLLIPDTDAVNHVFSDEEIAAFLIMEGSGVKRAAALALETMASNEAFVQKAIKILDLSTDGPKVSAELRARAKDLRSQAAAEEAATDGGGFDIAEMDLGNASLRDYAQRKRYYLGY